MRYRSTALTLPLLAAGAALVSCAQQDPQTSYCDALCDQAVSCADAERDAWPEYDHDGLATQCLTQAQRADPDCANAADGLDAATSELLSQCTDAIESNLGECDAFTGSIDQLKLGTPPTACASQGADAQATFDAVRDATAEANADLCGRFSWTFCDQVQSCVLDSLGVSEIPQSLIDLAGGTPTELCLADLDSQTAACVSGDLYAPETDLDAVNLMRQGARECLADFASVSCDQLFSGELSPTCAGAVQDPTAFAGALVSVGGQFITE